jgi:hypothetical protein
MRTHEDILNSVIDLSERLSGPSKLTVDSYNRYIKLVNIDLLRDLYGKPKDQVGYENKQYHSDALSPFKSEPTPLDCESGSGSLPGDYLHMLSAYYVDGNYTREVDVVTNAQSIKRRSNSLTGPSSRYPILEVFNNRFDIYPTTIDSVIIDYIKKPTQVCEPHYALKTENGIQVYDSASSVEFMWGIDLYPEIIRRILLYLGVATKNDFITAYMETKKQQEN